VELWSCGVVVVWRFIFGVVKIVMCCAVLLIGRAAEIFIQLLLRDFLRAPRPNLDVSVQP